MVKTDELAWRAVGVPGVFSKLLRDDKETGARSVLLRFEPGARFPAHDHPGGEEILILEGDLHVARDHLRAGDYLYTPPGGVHAAWSEAGCLAFVTLPKPVVVLDT